MRNRRHALIFVVVTVFIDTVGFGIIMPVMPQFLQGLSGGSLAESSALAGYLIVVYAGLQFLFAPLIGNLSDRFGRRPVLLVSLFAYGVNYLLAGLATSLWLLFVGRMLTGMTSATYATANALIADVSSAEERAQNFGLLGVAFGLGFIFGPTLGGMLGAWDLRAPFFAAAGLAFINVLYGWIWLPETLSANQRRRFDWRRANPVGMLVRVSARPALAGLIITLFIYNIGHHVYPSNWNFYTIEKFDWSPLQIGVSMGVVGVLMALVQGLLIRRVIPRWGATRTAFAGFTCAAVAFMGIAFAVRAESLYLWCAVSALAGLAGPAVAAILANQVPQNEQGELQGINASVSSLAAIIGPLAMTQSFAWLTGSNAPVYFPGIAFLLAGVLTLMAIVLFARATRRLAVPPTTTA